MDQPDDNRDVMQPENTYERFKRSVIWCSRLLGYHATASSDASVLTSDGHPMLDRGNFVIAYTMPGGLEPISMDSNTTNTGPGEYNTARPMTVDRQGGAGADATTANVGTGRSNTQAQVHNQSHSLNLCGSEAPSAVATQLHGAHDFNIAGNPTLINTGANTGTVSVTHVNNYGGVHELERMEKSISLTAQFDSRVQDPEHQCHPQTRTTILEQMKGWIDNLHAIEPIFWLCGPAGAGKSAIARTIALLYGRPKIAASFFFYRSDATRNDANLLFSTLAYQLSFTIPVIRDLVAKSLSNRPDLLMANIETQFEELIVQPFQALNWAALPVPIVVIIDGVDECTDEKLQRRFLETICAAVRDKRIPLRFVIASRREAHIENAIRRTGCPKMCLDLSDFNSDSDIEVYLTDKLAIIASQQGLDPQVWPEPRKINELVYRASGQFAYASLVTRFVGDEDCSAKTQLDIIIGLKPAATKSPFRHLDNLYLGILERCPDQEFLTSFLALFIVFLQLPNEIFDLHQDDYLLMDISEDEFRIKSRRLRSVFKFEPDIGVHHRSFLDFLQDPLRSRKYHISVKDATRRYLELIIGSLVQYLKKYSDNDYESYHFSPRFGLVLHINPVKFIIDVEGWQELLHPLASVWDEFLTNKFQNFSPKSHFTSCDECNGFRIIRYLLFHLMFLGDSSDRASLSSMTNFSPPLDPIGASGNTIQNNIRSCLDLLQARRRSGEVDSLYSTTFHLLTLLMSADPFETSKNIRSVSDALVMMDIIDRFTTSTGNLINLGGPDAIRKLFQLAVDIYARVPTLPPTLFFNTMYLLHDRQDKFQVEGVVYSDYCVCWKINVFSHFAMWQTPFKSMNRIPIQNCIIPVLWIYDGVESFNFLRIGVGSSFECHNHEITSWQQRLSSILKLAQCFQDFHAGGFVLHHEIGDVVKFEGLDFRYPIKICFWAVARSYVEEMPYLNDKVQLTFEANVLIFGRLFYCLYFHADKPIDELVLYNGDMVLNHRLETNIHEYVLDIIQRCCTEDPKGRPTMGEVIKEINIVVEKFESEPPPFASSHKRHPAVNVSSLVLLGSNNNFSGGPLNIGTLTHNGSSLTFCTDNLNNVDKRIINVGSINQHDGTFLELYDVNIGNIVARP